jgi:hypothetical protein
MSAAGYLVPTIFIFPRKNMKPELTDGTPVGSIFICHPSGWIQLESFATWFEYFISQAKKTLCC